MVSRTRIPRSQAQAKGRAFALACAIALAAAARSPRASAQSPEELRAARELFQEAFKDEKDKRYPEALEKFRRVAKVKESASVRYRIATVLAAMGKLREARDMYRALAAAKSSLPSSDQEASDSAAEKAAELDRRIPHLTLRLQDNPPPDVRVSVDGSPVPVTAIPRSIELDPGEHVILATAQGAKPLEEKLTLDDGAPELSHTVSLVPETPTPPPTPTQSPPRSSPNVLVPWVAVGAGAVLVIVGGGLLLSREGAISDIKDACPLNRCPTAAQSRIESDRSRAQTFGPLGVGVGLVGLAVAGFGVYMLVRAPKTAATQTYLRFATAHPELGLRF
jgi:hypothetical protein